MQWIKHERRGHFPAFYAVQSDGRLSSELAGPFEIDEAAAELKRQIDVAARRMKIMLADPAIYGANDDA